MLKRPLIFTFMIATGLVASAAMAGDVPQFEITIKDHKFTPSTVTIPADTKIALTVINADATAEEFESDSLNREKIIPAGGKGVVFIGPLKPGTYDFMGEFHQDTAKGQIIVK